MPEKETAAMLEHPAAGKTEQANHTPDDSKRQENADSEVEIVCMDDIEMQPISWLWPDRIALGKLTVLSGDPGLGKSQFTAFLAATVSKGRSWPDADTKAAVGDVVFLSAEDDASDTIKPRLVAAGADVRHCHVIQAIKVPDHRGRKVLRGFDLTQDVQRLGQALSRLGNVKLVVIDPVSAYLGKTDSNKNADMRGVLAPLAEMAAKHDAAIMALTHHNKSENQGMIGRVIGSIGLIAAARAGFVVVKDKQNPEIRYFLPIKNNIGNDRDGFAFHIEEVLLPNGVKTSKVCLHPDLVPAQKILTPESQDKPDSASGATDFLRKLLEKGPISANEVYQEGHAAGHSEASLQRASKKLGIKSRKGGMNEGWTWGLPSMMQPSISSQSSGER